MTKIVELYGVPAESEADWRDIITAQQCPFLGRKCLKSRKSQPNVTIGSCTVAAGKDRANIMICPFRLLERQQIFTDCIHLLALHEPGNELHMVPELNVPGGSIDYCIASVRGRVIDFVESNFKLSTRRGQCGQNASGSCTGMDSRSKGRIACPRAPLA